MTDKDRVEVLNQELIPEAPDGKLGRLDIHDNQTERADKGKT